MSCSSTEKTQSFLLFLIQTWYISIATHVLRPRSGCNWISGVSWKDLHKPQTGPWPDCQLFSSQIQSIDSEFAGTIKAFAERLSPSLKTLWRAERVLNVAFKAHSVPAPLDLNFICSPGNERVRAALSPIPPSGTFRRGQSFFCLTNSLVLEDITNRSGLSGAEIGVMNTRRTGGCNPISSQCGVFIYLVPTGGELNI